jgi:hypothetical protein
MTLPRVRLLCAALTLVAAAGCRKPVPEQGPLTGTSKTLSVSGQYRRVALDSIERMSIEHGRLVLHAPSSELAVDLPANADPEQKNRGWALVTEGEDSPMRTLTFTHETSLDDFTIQVPDSAGQIAYGSLGGRNGNDVLLLAYGSNKNCYWGWVEIGRLAHP